MLRLQLDEHVPHAVAEQRAMRGIDVATAAMSGLLNTPDSDILEHARLHQRVVITYDSDYVALHRRGVAHAGIAYFPNAPTDVGVHVEMLELLAVVFDPLEFENWLEYL